jgi:hypothetical protein
MVRLVRFAILLGCISVAGSAFATTYYIATNGSDSNNGTSTSTPWLHAPGMSGCSGNCAAKTPQAGDRFILRGGDTWHYNSAAGVKGLPWSISGTGTSANQIYYGVDQTWFSGSAWSRPILNGDNPTSRTAVGSCGAGNASNANMVGDNTTWGVIDDFELLGLCWSHNPNPYYGDAFITVDSHNTTYKNIYIHGWTHTAGAASQGVGWAGSTDGRVTHWDSVVVDGSDSDPKSLCSICFNAYDVHNSVFRYNSNMVGNGGKSIYNNLFEYIQEPYDSAHGNVMEWNNEAGGTGNYVYNNLVRHVSTAVTFWVCPSGSNNDYYFNNVMYDVASQMWDFDKGSAVCGGGGTGNFVNNTFVGGQIGVSGTWNSRFDSNHMINSSALGSPLTLVNQIVATEAAAASYGYSATSSYAPTSENCNGNASASGCPIDRGTNLTSVCNAIGGTVGASLCKDTTLGPNYNAVTHRVNGTVRAPVSRPSTGAWDAGAFQYSSQTTPAPNPPTGLTAIPK